MLNRSEALKSLKLTETATEEQIKKQFRILAVKYHPDKLIKDISTEKVEKAKRKFHDISEAYQFLTNPPHENGTQEFQPSWHDIIQQELAEQSGNAIATSDEHKPTIQAFFNSLFRKLEELEKDIKLLEPNSLIDKFEGISIVEQKENLQYTLSSINAAKQIATLLYNFINTKSESHWKVVDELRIAYLKLCLLNEFKKFGKDGQLIVKDAGTFALSGILLNHLSFLRNPLKNFKSTEDRYVVSLLSEISGELIEYQNTLLDKVDEFFDKRIAFSQNRFLTEEGKGYIAAQINNFLYKVIELNQLGKIELKAKSEEITSLKAEINEAAKYVVWHCHFPDNIDIYNPKIDKRKMYRYGLRGMLQNAVIKLMLTFNDFITEKELSIEPFKVGYASSTEYQNDLGPKLRDFIKSNKPAYQCPVLCNPFLEAQGFKVQDTEKPMGAFDNLKQKKQDILLITDSKQEMDDAVNKNNISTSNASSMELIVISRSSLESFINSDLFSPEKINSFLIDKAVKGIEYYLNRERSGWNSHLSFVSQLFDQDRGKNRGLIYQNLLLNDPDYKHKLLALQALLGASDGRTLQSDVARFILGKENQEDTGVNIADIQAALKSVNETIQKYYLSNGIQQAGELTDYHAAIKKITNVANHPQLAKANSLPGSVWKSVDKPRYYAVAKEPIMERAQGFFSAGKPRNISKNEFKKTLMESNDVKLFENFADAKAYADTLKVFNLRHVGGHVYQVAPIFSVELIPGFEFKCEKDQESMSCSSNDFAKIVRAEFGNSRDNEPSVLKTTELNIKSAKKR